MTVDIRTMVVAMIVIVLAQDHHLGEDHNNTISNSSDHGLRAICVDSAVHATLKALNRHSFQAMCTTQRGASKRAPQHFLTR